MFFAFEKGYLYFKRDDMIIPEFVSLFLFRARPVKNGPTHILKKVEHAKVFI